MNIDRLAKLLEVIDIDLFLKDIGEKYKKKGISLKDYYAVVSAYRKI